MNILPTTAALSKNVLAQLTAGECRPRKMESDRSRNLRADCLGSAATVNYFSVAQSRWQSQSRRADDQDEEQDDDDEQCNVYGDY